MTTRALCSCCASIRGMLKSNCEVACLGHTSLKHTSTWKAGTHPASRHTPTHKAGSHWSHTLHIHTQALLPSRPRCSSEAKSDGLLKHRAQHFAKALSFELMSVTFPHTHTNELPS